MANRIRSLLNGFICIALISGSGFDVCQAQLRQEISLNGTWHFKWDNENRLAYPPDDDGWTEMEVGRKSRSDTGFGRDGTNHWAWYKRNVRVPNEMKGRRIKIRFTRVLYQTYVYWNGVLVGEHLDGDIPFAIDVTDQVRFGQENELLVGVIDRISLQRPDILPYTESDFRMPESRPNQDPPRGSLLAPASYIHNMYGGICDDVHLIAHPEVYIEDFHINTSVRRSEISIEVTVQNEGRRTGNYQVQVWIEEDGEPIQHLPAKALDTHEGLATRLGFSAIWENPHVWSHNDPHLYTLVMQLKRGDRVADERKFRFGFREFWIEGTDFYLNGKVFKIRRNPLIGLSGSSTDEIRDWMEQLKAMQINQVRIHTQGFPERIAEVADEVGMTLCTESTFWSRAPWYDIENPEMWANAKAHWEGLIKMFKNHPSVVMHSIENEMLSTGSYLMHADPEKWRRYENKWIEVGQMVRKLDPTKPLQYSWGHDIRGWVETANIHYVRDIRYFFQYPKDLYWIEGENLTQRERNRDYKWKKDRPLIKGEYGYWYHANPPHGLTPFIGEDAYTGDNWYQAWQWCLKKKNEAYRYSGVIGNPWSFGKDRYKFFPLQEAYLKDWRANFYGGERMRKEVIVVNEDYDPVSMDLMVDLTAGDRVLSSQHISLEMSEGSRRIQDMEFHLPVVERRVNAELNLRLIQNEKVLYSNTYPVHIFPRMKPAHYDENATGLYDPDGKTFREMTYGGFAVKRVDILDAAALAGLKVLILGKDAVVPPFHDEGKLLHDFVRHGGRVIVLEQGLIEKLDWLPYALEIDKTHTSTPMARGRTDLPILDDITDRGLDATIAFAMMPDHPILENIEDNDLKYWRGIHQVSRNNFRRPKFWNYQTVAYVGSGNGIEHTPLVTLPYDSGLFILSQFILSDVLSKEPAAFMLFNNMLTYAQGYTPAPQARVGVFTARESNTRKVLNSFGARFDDLKDLTPNDLANYQVLFFDGSRDLSPAIAALQSFLNDGGTVVLRELTPEVWGHVRGILPDELDLAPLPEPETVRLPTGRTCPARAWKSGYDPLLAGITNYDLYWRTPSGYTAMFGEEIAALASYSVTGGVVPELIQPGVMVRMPHGKGQIIIDQVDWLGGLNSTRDNACRIISNLLNNLGIAMRPNISFHP